MTTVRGLDRYPTRRELAQLYKERMGRELPTDRDFKILKPGTMQAPTWDKRGAIQPGAIGTRLPHGIFIALPVAPRTKKNGGKGSFGGIRQKDAYKRYRRGVVELIAGLVGHLELPLKRGHYNIAAIYYVDRYGKQADRPGLDQGLFDALQDAGVVENDWDFRTTDGTRIVFGDAEPRVELTITELREG